MTFTVIETDKVGIKRFFKTYVSNRTTEELEELEMLIKVEIRERDFAYINGLVPHEVEE